MVGGFAGLAGAWVAGPRLGRFKDGKPVPIPGHNAVYYTTGAQSPFYCSFVGVG